MKLILQQILMGIAQTALAAMGGYFVKEHWITGEQSKTFVSWCLEHGKPYVPIVLGLAMTLWQKRVGIKRQLIALMPGIHTMNDVDAYLASGKPTPKILTPPSTSPGVPLPAQPAPPAQPPSVIRITGVKP